MSSVTMIRSDYSDKPLTDEDDPQKVKLTVKVGTGAAESYDLDFSASEVEEFMDRIKARRIKGGAGPATVTNESSLIRKWAASNGYEVNAKGAIPAAVREAYDKATSE